MKPLIISELALSLLTTENFSYDDVLVKDFVSFTSGGIVGRGGDAGCYLLTQQCLATSRLLVIRRWPEGLFASVPASDRRTVFDRCVRLALQSFDRSVDLNPRWLPYHDGNLVSIFASGIGLTKRLVAETSAYGSESTYVFAYEDVTRNLRVLSPDYEVFRKSVAEFAILSKTPVTDQQKSAVGQIDLEVFGPQLLEQKA